MQTSRKLLKITNCLRKQSGRITVESGGKPTPPPFHTRSIEQKGGRMKQKDVRTYLHTKPSISQLIWPALELAVLHFSQNIARRKAEQGK